MEDKKLDWKLCCFWVAVAVVVVVFVIPVETRTFTRNGIHMSSSKTLWDLISGNKPKTDLYSNH